MVMDNFLALTESIRCNVDKMRHGYLVQDIVEVMNIIIFTSQSMSA